MTQLLGPCVVEDCNRRSIHDGYCLVHAEQLEEERAVKYRVNLRREAQRRELAEWGLGFARRSAAFLEKAHQLDEIAVHKYPSLFPEFHANAGD